MNSPGDSPIAPLFRVCDGVRVRFADNKADSSVTVLMLSPWPESLWAFRRIWDRVSAVARAAGADGEPEVHEDSVSAYALGRLAEPARFVRHYPEQNPALHDLLPTITTPAQIIAGRDDDLVPWSNNEYLANLLPNSEIHLLDAGHFAWEQASEDYGRLIVDW